MSPPYCCALLRDAGGRFLLEGRPACARHAPGRLTCFGGHRRCGESPAACLRRELIEELGWALPTTAFAPAVSLHIKGGLVAWFYRVRWLAPGRDPRGIVPDLPGRRLWRIPAAALARAPLSAWHRPVLEAFLRGQGHVALA